MNDQPTGVGSIYELFRQGSGLLDDGEAAAAVEPLRAAAALAPDSAAVHEALGRACFATSRIREARRAFARAVELDPSNAYAHYGLGRALERQGHLLSAARHFKLASAMSPEPMYARAAQRVARRTR